MLSRLTSIALLGILSTGCASITTGTSQSIKLETYTAQGTEIAGAVCNMHNDHGAFQVTTPGTVLVHKSGSDMSVSCAAPNQPIAKGVVTSRANAALAGNILFGGGIGAMIDHSTGSAYNYPSWVRLVTGKELAFDKGTELAVGPSPGVEILPGGVIVKPMTVATKDECSPMPQCLSYN